MSTQNTAQDPLEFIRNMWGQLGFSLPGMVTPTLDINELDKRITDLKAVEGWLKMNLNMLQMTTQGLEMQRAALAAVKAMSEHTAASPEPGEDSASNPFMASMAMWPWNLMGTSPAAQPETPPEPSAKDTPPPRRTTRRKAAEKKPRP